MEESDHNESKAEQVTDRDLSSKPADGLERVRALTVILSAAAIITITVKSSGSLYLRAVWDALIHVNGVVWSFVYNLFRRNDPLLHILGTTAMGVASFLIFNALFMVCDITGHPRWLLKYKVQDGKNQPVDLKMFWKCVQTCSFNLLVTTPMYLAFTYPAANYLGAYHTGDLPTFERFLLEFVVFSILNEIGLYYSHRLLHTPYLYAKFHKKHHEWTAPIGITSINAGVVEIVISNLIPMSLGPFIMRSHLMVVWIWAGYVLLYTTIDHGGYHLPFLFSPEAHDYHHKTFNCNYGTLGILDMLHKTNHPFAGTIDAQRHYVSCSLKPIKEIHPDPRKPSNSAVKRKKDII